MNDFIIFGIIILVYCALQRLYTNDKIDYKLPKYTWAEQEQQIYRRSQWMKGMTTTGIILTAIGLIGELLGL